MARYILQTARSPMERPMAPTRVLCGLFVAVAALATAAFDAPPTLTYNPQHYVNNDPVWEQFNLVHITADMKAGAYRATFPGALTGKQNRPMRVTGFILPLEASSKSAHFMLVRRNTGCPFCPPNAPTEAVEIFSRTPVTYTGQEMAVTGVLRLVASSGDGLFFRLDQASAAPTGH